MPYLKFKVYNKEKFITHPPFARQIRRLPDGSTGIEFRGRVYNLFEDQIDISLKSFSISECPLVRSRQILDRKKIKKEDFYYDTSKYNPIFYFNGLYDDLNAFLYNLDKKKIDYLKADYSKGKINNNIGYDFEVKLSGESVKDENLNLNRIIQLLLESREDFSIKSVEKQLRDMINNDIDENLKEKNINLLIDKYPKKLVPKLFVNLGKALKDQKSNSKEFSDLNKEKQKLELQLNLKDEEIKTYNELLEKKADDEYKINKISEQMDYISELEKNIDYLHNQNYQLNKDKESFIKTDLKKKFLNYISNTFESVMPRLRLIQKSELIIFDKFTNISPLFKLLKKINDKEKINFKKVRTSNNWFEVSEHISTGDEKRGRIYFSILKNNLVAIVVDYKYNDKDQFLKFDKIINLDLSNVN